MQHMDEYTILYQAKNNIATEEEIKRFLEECIPVEVDNFLELMQHDSEMVRELAMKWLEKGIKEMRYEYPPSVSKRMEKYYNNNKNYLAQALTPHVKRIITQYKGQIS